MSIYCLVISIPSVTGHTRVGFNECECKCEHERECKCKCEHEREHERECDRLLFSFRCVIILLYNGSFFVWFILCFDSTLVDN